MPIPLQNRFNPLTNNSKIAAKVLLAIILAAVLVTTGVGALYFSIQKQNLLDKTSNSLMEVLFKHSQEALVAPINNPSEDNLRHSAELINSELSQVGAVAVLVDTKTNKQYSQPFSEIGGVTGPEISERPNIPQSFVEQVKNGDNKYFDTRKNGETDAVIAGSKIIKVGDNNQKADSGLVLLGYMPLDTVETEIRDLLKLVVTTALIAIFLAGLIGFFIVRQLLAPLKRLDLSPATPEAEGKNIDDMSLNDLIDQFNSNSKDLKKSLADLKAKESDSRRFVADVSHELRTPIASMMALIDILGDEVEKMPEDSAEAALIIKDEIRRLHALTEDLLEISRLDAKTASLNLQECRLEDIVHNMLKTRHWEDDISVKGKAEAIVDRRRFDIVIANLVVNAIKYGEKPITIEISEDSHEAKVSVTNHGKTIPPEVLENIFKRFYQGDVSRNSDGTGLGLSIALANMKFMRGRLTATSQDGVTTFTAIIPKANITMLAAMKKSGTDET